MMARCGHVPHEEQPDNFVRLVLEALGKDEMACDEPSMDDWEAMGEVVPN